MNGRTMTALALLAALTPGARAGDETEDASRTEARQRLTAAKETRRGAQKRTGEEKRRILEQTVAAYHLVLDGHPDQPDLCAEAAFRIGEIERSLGDAEAARDAFAATVTRRDAAPRFAARAGNELGHLSRRAGRLEEALAEYRRVARDDAAQDGEAAKALTWSGKVLVALDRPEEARVTWLSIADTHPSEPVAAVRAADLAALSALEEGDPALARRVVEETAERYSEQNLAQEWWSPAVEEALRKMKAPGRFGGPED